MPAQKRPAACLACATTDDEIPLIQLTYRGGALSICPQHMPVLIHDPAQLLDRLPHARARKAAKRRSRTRS